MMNRISQHDKSRTRLISGILITSLVIVGGFALVFGLPHSVAPGVEVETVTSTASVQSIQINHGNGKIIWVPFGNNVYTAQFEGVALNDTQMSAAFGVNVLSENGVRKIIETVASTIPGSISFTFFYQSEWYVRSIYDTDAHIVPLRESLRIRADKTPAFVVAPVVVAPVVVIEPPNLSVEHDNGIVFISWNQVDTADSYTVYRSTTVTMSNTTLIDTIPGGSVTDVPGDGTWFYGVVASNGSVQSVFSNIVSVTLETIVDTETGETTTTATIEDTETGNITGIVVVIAIIGAIVGVYIMFTLFFNKIPIKFKKMP